MVWRIECAGSVGGRLGLGMAIALSLAAPVNTWSENPPRAPRVDVIATGLEAPWALAFGSGGELFVTERPGRIRVIRDGRLVPEPLATLNVAAIGEGGLMGLATDPGFPANRLLYVCYTARDDGRLVNRLARLTVLDGKAGAERVLLDGIPGADQRDGCRLKFGPDGRLYATTGDAGMPDLAQRLDSLAGKILRLAADGSIPPDNPFPGSPVYAIGLRNPQGLAWDRAGRMLATDLVPGAHDEINEIVRGGNYGWPAASGVAHDPRYRDPLIESGGAIWKPSGIALRGDTLYVAALLGRQLVRIRLTPDTAVPLPSQLEGAWGRLRDVIVGLEGALYVATSNRDGRGAPDPADDRILRVWP
jgi:glucose/arabinose dehydrogenase